MMITIIFDHIQSHVFYKAEHQCGQGCDQRNRKNNANKRQDGTLFLFFGIPQRYIFIAFHFRITSSLVTSPSSNTITRSAASEIFSSWVTTIMVCPYISTETRSKSNI